jgi:hypothetical protein
MGIRGRQEAPADGNG